MKQITKEHHLKLTKGQMKKMIGIFKDYIKFAERHGVSTASANEMIRIVGEKIHNLKQA